MRSPVGDVLDLEHGHVGVRREGDEHGSQWHWLREPVATLGRASLAAPVSTASFCALVLPEEYATHKYLSRQQAEIRRLPEGAFELRNLGKNSVKVGRPLRPL